MAGDIPDRFGRLCLCVVSGDPDIAQDMRIKRRKRAALPCKLRCLHDP